jgi:CRISPR/Cas system CMR subunit Cmr6 (Cas7 group RAMP superfamily)
MNAQKPFDRDDEKASAVAYLELVIRTLTDVAHQDHAILKAFEKTLPELNSENVVLLLEATERYIKLGIQYKERLISGAESVLMHINASELPTVPEVPDTTLKGKLA